MPADGGKASVPRCSGSSSRNTRLKQSMPGLECERQRAARALYTVVRAPGLRRGDMVVARVRAAFRGLAAARSYLQVFRCRDRRLSLLPILNAWCEATRAGAPECLDLPR